MRKKENEAKEILWKSVKQDMVYLVVCSIKGHIPEPTRVAKMDLQKVFALSKSQSLEAMTCIALERLKTAQPSVMIPNPEHVLERWEEARNKVIRKTLLMDAAREQLFSYMESQKIWHLPLKGVVLSHLYPEFGMRQMADNDILFDADFRQQIHDWFVEHGYTVESFCKSNHDEYHKKPIYNFEMHAALFDEDARPQFAQYYRTLERQLCPVSGKQYEYYMTDEDFYIYLLAHEYKHHTDKGTGLRSLLDVYVYHTVKNNMNAVYVNTELKKLGLFEFEQEMRILSQKIFGQELQLTQVSASEWQMLDELLCNHTYGTRENAWRKKVKNIQPDRKEISVAMKSKYLIQRMFPGRDYMEVWCQLYAPLLGKYRWFRPAAYVWRIVLKGIEHRKQIKAEFDTVRKI